MGVAYISVKCNYYKSYYDNQKILLIQIYNLTYFVIIQMKHFDEILVFVIKLMSPISPAIYWVATEKYLSYAFEEYPLVSYARIPILEIKINFIQMS